MTYSERLLQARLLLNSLGRRQRRGFTLIELLVVVVIIGILASVALPSFVGAQDKARNASVAANVNSIRMALEQYATDFNGSYPLSTGFPASLSTNGYLPGNRLPKSPWGAVSQTTNGPALDGEDLTAATALTGAALPTLGSLLQATGRVQDPPDSVGDYGLIQYDYDAGSQIYVVYGTGKKGRTAVLAGATSNGSN